VILGNHRSVNRVSKVLIIIRNIKNNGSIKSRLNKWSKKSMIGSRLSKVSIIPMILSKSTRNIRGSGKCSVLSASRNYLNRVWSITLSIVIIGTARNRIWKPFHGRIVLELEVTILPVLIENRTWTRIKKCFRNSH